MIHFQNEDDISRESSPCKSPDSGIKDKGAEFHPKEPTTEAFTKSTEEIGMDKHWWMGEIH
jgi:hypothetical protein